MYEEVIPYNSNRGHKQEKNPPFLHVVRPCTTQLLHVVSEQKTKFCAHEHVFSSLGFLLVVFVARRGAEQVLYYKVYIPRYLESPSTVLARERMKLMSCFVGETFGCFELMS